MPVEKVQTLRNDSLIKDSLQKSVDLYKQNEELLNKKVNILSDQNNKLAEELYSSRSLSTWEKIGFFSLGAILTGLASYGIYQAAISTPH